MSIRRFFTPGGRNTDPLRQDLQKELSDIELTDAQWDRLAKAALDIKNIDIQQNRRLCVLLVADIVRVLQP